MNKFKIEWLDSGRAPKCKPDPNFPKGKDVVFGGAADCKVDLPYPAKRCGTYIIECTHCGIRVGVTTAGRPDDPRSAKIPCKIEAPIQ